MPAMAVARTPLLELEGIKKSFPGVHAVKGARLDLYAGEVHALVGENGAGKSTLIKVLAGALLPDAGTIRINGAAVSFRSPEDAQREGVSVIYQEYNLVPGMTVLDNLFLGREISR